MVSDLQGLLRNLEETGWRYVKTLLPEQILVALDDYYVALNMGLAGARIFDKASLETMNAVKNWAERIARGRSQFLIDTLSVAAERLSQAETPMRLVAVPLTFNKSGQFYCNVNFSVWQYADPRTAGAASVPAPSVH